MSGLAADWLRQAEADLEHARYFFAGQDHDWACFAAHQAAEKAAKAARAEAERAIGGAEAILVLGRGGLQRR